MGSLYQGEEEVLNALDILALSDDAMFAIDDRHRIVFWNRSIQRLLGYTHDEVAGRSCATVLAGTDHYGNRYCSESCAVQQIARRGEPVRQFRLKLRARDATPLLIDISVVKFTMRVSKRVLLVHIVRPVEEMMTGPAEPARAIAPAPPVPALDPRLRVLTARELEILVMLAGGLTSQLIAARLNISPLTTRNHLQHIFEKLEVHSRTEAVALAYRANLVAASG